LKGFRELEMRTAVQSHELLTEEFKVATITEFFGPGPASPYLEIFPIFPS